MAATSNARFPEFTFPGFMDFSKFAEQFKVPNLDTDALMTSQRKNIEAFSAANRVAYEGVQAVAKRQAEIMRQGAEEASEAVRQLSTVGTPQEALAKQAEMLKHAFELSLANVRELSELGAKSNNEAVELLNQRVVEGLEEIKAAIETVAKAK